jgi:hypothetical protein
MGTIVKIMTHESIIHSQLSSLERILNREINCQLTLNVKGIKSNFEFPATEEEIEKVKSDLGYHIYVFTNGEWTRRD